MWERPEEEEGEEEEEEAGRGRRSRRSRRRRRRGGKAEEKCAETRKRQSRTNIYSVGEMGQEGFDIIRLRNKGKNRKDAAVKKREESTGDGKRRESAKRRWG